MPLTDTAIRNAKPGPKTKRLFDGGGLYLEISSTGSKLWRLKYRIAKREKRLAFGIYPEVSLKDARMKRDDARKLLATGVDPNAQRKAIEFHNASTLEAVAREWFAKFSPSWSADHAERVIRRFERDIFPWMGARPIGEITAPELLTALRRVENRGVIETAHRVLQNCSQVFRYAVATGRSQRDPTSDLRGALPPARGKHFASITEPKAIGELLRAIGGYKGSFITQCALRLAPLVFVRPGELRRAEWAELDLDAAEGRIPASKMKMRVIHVVPLSSQAVSILRELHPLTGNGKYVFPGTRTKDRPMSENTVLAALRRMGYGTNDMTGHGFRSMACTILNEQGWDRDVIERQLAHAERDNVRAAYNYAEHLQERRRMMQAWAEYLDTLSAGANVIPLRTAAR